MSVFIAISQTARIAAIWSKRTVTKQILLTVAVVAYTALLNQRERRINEYYSRDNPDENSRRSRQ